MKRHELMWAAIKTVLLGIFSLLFLLPMFWMVTSALKSTNEVFAVDWHWLPSVWRWENFAIVWSDPEVSMLSAYGNTAFITLISTACQLMIASMAAYAFAKIKFQGKNVVFTMFLATMMMPTEVTIVPRFILFKTVGLYNNLWAVILPHFFNATSIFMLRQFYMGLPTDLMEAAKIDGAGHPRIFSQVMMPLTKTALVSQCVLLFVSTWNEYMAPLIFLANQKLYTAALVVKYQVFEEGSSTSQLMAASASAIIPTVIIFMFCQRYFVEGIATSGVKG
jgi:multiple sugar transport system permease protein